MRNIKSYQQYLLFYHSLNKMFLKTAHKLGHWLTFPIFTCEFKFTVGLHNLCIFSIIKKFKDGQRLMVMLLINYLNLSFCNLKQYIKDEFIGQIVNYIQLA